MLFNFARMRRFVALARREVYTRFFSPTFTSMNKHLKEFDIGQWTYGAPRVSFGDSGRKLRIGKFCSFGSNVRLYLGGEHNTDWVTTYPFPAIFDFARKYEGHPYSKGDIIIGNDVWIGNNATILSGVTIGHGAVIGAHAVVTGDIRPYSIVAGNPAKEVRRRFDNKTISDLLEIAWWDWPLPEIQKAMPLLLSNDVQAFIDSYKGKGSYCE